MSELEDIESLKPKKAPRKTTAGVWLPSMNPSQRQAWDATARYVLLHSEKASGKGIIALHSMVRHCYDEEDALAIILSPTVRTGKFGLMHDLEKLVLPAWRDGNRHPDYLVDGSANPQAGELLDTGIGLEFTEPRTDAASKDRYLYVGNRHGGWSTVIMFSIPYESAIEARIKAIAPSFAMVDELTDIGGEDFFTYIAAQLGRRRKVKGPQQYYGVCNPRGKAHWVYKKWFDESIDEKTGERDPDFLPIHIPLSENIHRLPPGYRENLQKSFKHPILRRRLLFGEWVDMPSGDAIFRDIFIREIHVSGDALKEEWELPLPNRTISVGYDPGPKNFSIHFVQPVMTEKGIYWKVIDELNYVGRPTRNTKIMGDVLDRMKFWNEVCECEFSYLHIADDAIRDDEVYGEFGARRLRQASNGEISFKFCAKGNDSVPARVQTLIDLCVEEKLIISAKCPKTIDMFEGLLAKRVKEGDYDEYQGLRPKRSAHIHPFDSLSYPITYHTFHPSQFASRRGAVMGVYSAGDPDSSK